MIPPDLYYCDSRKKFNNLVNKTRTHVFGYVDKEEAIKVGFTNIIKNKFVNSDISFRPNRISITINEEKGIESFINLKCSLSLFSTRDHHEWRMVKEGLYETDNFKKISFYDHQLLEYHFNNLLVFNSLTVRTPTRTFNKM